MSRPGTDEILLPPEYLGNSPLPSTQSSRPSARSCLGCILIDLVDRRRHVDPIHDTRAEDAARGDDI